MQGSLPREWSWWLVPNLLALDAPVVAVVWQRFLAAQFGANVPLTATTALAATVWCIYLSDRWLDARRGCRDTERHRVAATWPVTFGCGAVCAGFLAATFAAQLPLSYLQEGLVLGLCVAVYLVFIHAVAARLVNLRGLKELLVAAGFAAGVSIPLSVAEQPLLQWLPSVCAFAVLCWLNCRMIDRWESEHHVQGSTHWLAAAVGFVLFVCCYDLPLAIGLAIAGSLAGLVAVQVLCANKPRAARVLADVALLFPLLCWLIP